MRTDPRASNALSEGLNGAHETQHRVSPMTSRGTQYWKSGAIPLIAPEILGDIIATLADLAVVISRQGTVLSVLANPVHSDYAQLDHWEQGDIREVLTTESVPKFDRQLELFLNDDMSALRPIELNHFDQVGQWEFPVNYTFHSIGPDGAILMLGRDLRPISEMQQQLVKAQIALERDYETQREYDTRFRVLMEATRDPVLYVSVASGKIVEANPAAAVLLNRKRDELVGSTFAQEFDGQRKGEVIEHLSSAALSDGAGAISLQARRSKASVSAIPTLFRAAGERLLLVRLEGPDEAERAPDGLAHHLAGLYEAGADAIVFSDKDGAILTANEAFLNLVDAAHALTVRGRSLADFLSRGSVDLKVLLENAARSGQMKMYATKLSGQYGGQRAVEISTTHLDDQHHPAFAFIMRDASRADAVRVPTSGPGEDSVRSVMELVGSATLKDIVAETTDVVEKMCIETAVELTNNNRVAAAEMLGLSRQSLYVKLRKYDLLNK